MMNNNTEKLHKAIIHNLINWLKVNGKQKQSIAKVAELTGYSKRHIRPRFYQYHRITLGRFWQKLHLSAMINDLKRKEHSAMETAAIYHFPPRQSLPHSFKKETGCTPGCRGKNGNCSACCESCKKSLIDNPAQSAPPAKIKSPD